MGEGAGLVRPFGAHREHEAGRFGHAAASIRSRVGRSKARSNFEAGSSCHCSTRLPGATLALPAFSDYSAYIMNRQYTIRGVPAELDRALRRRARREARSLNAVVVETLARGLELEAEPVRYTDLDHLIGTWQEDPEFDRAVADFERVDGEAWG